MKRILIGLAAGAILLSGCGGSDKPKAAATSTTPAPATSSAKAAPTPTETTPPAPEPTPTTAAPAPPANSFADLKLYMKDNFVDATWYSSIKGYADNGGQTWVSTSLYPKDSNKDAARAICSAVSGFQLGNGGFKGVRVAASTGLRLSWRRTLSDPC